MAPDHRSRPRAPSCQQRTDRKWQGRGAGWREVAGGGKTTLSQISQMITWSHVQRPPLLTLPWDDTVLKMPFSCPRQGNPRHLEG